jgi:acyl carrier protein
LEPSFLDSLGGRSLDRVELAMALEEAFDVVTPVEDSEKIRSFRTKQEVLDYIRECKKGGNSI